MRPALLLSLLLAPGIVAAQETASDTLLTVEHYLDWEQASDPQISPDGAQIVYTRRWVNKLEDKWESALWIMNADGSHNRFLVKGSDARWSPDGTRILYLADGEPKGTQLFVRWMDAEGASSQVTRVTEKPADPRWAPDGKAIAFVMLAPDSTPWSISLPKPPEGAKWTPAPRVVENLHYRQDRVGYMEQGFTHLFLVPADGGTARALTSGRWNVGARFDGLVTGAGYDWTPDGRTIVFDGLRDSTWDRQYETSRLYAVDVANGAIRALTSRPGNWSNPAVSPDGRSVAFTGYDSTEHTHRTSDLWVIGIDGSGARDVSKSFDRDPGQAPDDGERRCAREQAAREGRGNLVRLHRGHADPGLDRQAALIRGRQEVSADPRDPWRAVRDVQRRVRLHVPELRSQRLRGPVRKPARLDRVRRRILERHRPQLSRARLRRSHGGRGRGDRRGVRRHDSHVRLRVLRGRRALELGHRPHRPVRRRCGALPRDRLDQHGGADGHSPIHLQLFPSAVLGQAGRVARPLFAHAGGAHHHADPAH